MHPGKPYVDPIILGSQLKRIQSVLNHGVGVNGLNVHHGVFHKDPHMS